MAGRKIGLFLYLFALSFAVFASGKDEVINIAGKIIDAETKEPLPYAHVFVGETGTVSNQEGLFNLAIDADLLQHDLKVSFIGYQSATVSLGDRENRGNLTVAMAPAALELAGVEVRSGQNIFNEVIKRLDFNYDYSHQSTLCFFSEQLSTQLGKQYIAEGIVDIYLPNNNSQNDIQVSVVKSRKETYENQFNEDFVMVKGHAMDMVQSIVWRDDSFLNQKKRKHYEFSYDGVTQYNEKEVLIVNFEPATRRGKYTGTMYVDTESYAIIKVEYIPDTSKSNFWESARWTEEFNYRNGRWFLSRVSYTGEWFENDQLFSFETLLVVNIVQTVDNTPAMGLLLKKNETFFEEAENEKYGDDFWKGFSFVKQHSSDSF